VRDDIPAVPAITFLLTMIFPSAVNSFSPISRPASAVGVSPTRKKRLRSSLMGSGIDVKGHSVAGVVMLKVYSCRNQRLEGVIGERKAFLLTKKKDGSTIFSEDTFLKRKYE
jgi:hypothetical protein